MITHRYTFQSLHSTEQKATESKIINDNKFHTYNRYKNSHGIENLQQSINRLPV